MDDYKYYYYVAGVSGTAVTLKFLYSEGEWESSSLDPDPETQGIQSFTVKRLGSEYYTNTTEPNYMYGVTDDDFLVSRAGSTSTLFISELDEVDTFWMSTQSAGVGDASSPDYLRLRTFSTATGSAYNETKLRFSDCTDCEADYQLISTATSPSTEVCPPNISDQGILPASDGLVYGQLAESNGLVTLEYCTKRQYIITGYNSSNKRYTYTLDTEFNSFVVLAGPGVARVMQNGTAFGSTSTGYGDKHGVSFDNTVKVKRILIEQTDQGNDTYADNCRKCIGFKCGDTTHDLAWLDSANRDDTGLLVIDGEGGSFDGTTLTVSGGSSVEIASQMGIRSYCEPDGTQQDQYKKSPIRIGFAFDISVTGTEGASVTHGYTLVFGNSTDGEGGSIDGIEYPIIAGQTYQMRYCNTFQVDLDSGTNPSSVFVESGFVKGPGVSY